MRHISTMKLLVCVAMVTMANLSPASAARCPGAIKITDDSDYLVNIHSIIESDCLQDAGNNEALLKEVFSSREVVTTTGKGWTNYQITLRAERQEKNKEIYVRFNLSGADGERKKVMANAEFKNMPSLTQDVFVDIWKAKRKPSLRRPDLPADLETYDYSLAGARPGSVRITTVSGNILISLIYQEK